MLRGQIEPRHATTIIMLVAFITLTSKLTLLNCPLIAYLLAIDNKFISSHIDMSMASVRLKAQLRNISDAIKALRNRPRTIKPAQMMKL